MIHEFSADRIPNFSEYVNRVMYKGERFTLVRGGKPVAELSPVPSGTRLSELPDLVRSLPRLEESDAEAFLRDLEKAREALSARLLDDPWES